MRSKDSTDFGFFGEDTRALWRLAPESFRTELDLCLETRFTLWTLEDFEDFLGLTPLTRGPSSKIGEMGLRISCIFFRDIFVLKGRARWIWGLFPLLSLPKDLEDLEDRLILVTPLCAPFGLRDTR